MMSDDNDFEQEMLQQQQQQQYADASLSVACTVSLDRAEAHDRIVGMRLQEESDAYRCADYFSFPPEGASGAAKRCKGKPVDAECRRKMWEWCTQIVDFCKFSRETVSVAMSFLDRYLSAGVTAGDVHAARARASRKEYQLAAMTALYIAVKLNEPLEMETSLVSDLSRGCYTAREVAHMERRMLDALTWRTSDPTPMHFLRHYLALLPRRCTESDAAATELLDLGRHQIEYAESEYAFVTVNPSTIAAAALINALETIGRWGNIELFIGALLSTSGINVAGEEMRYIRAMLVTSFAELQHDVDEKEEGGDDDDDVDPEFDEEDEDEDVQGRGASGRSGTHSKGMKPPKTTNSFATRSPVCVMSKRHTCLS